MAGGGKANERGPRPVTPERPAHSNTPERDPRRVVTEAEWLNPGAARPKSGDRS
jgi:hypothetical protein